ncbi:MAG: FecR domain-containing protein [Phycisphaerales bacterium]|nr:FecR domain-containing protein [Phycisphaerales bacterium]
MNASDRRERGDNEVGDYLWNASGPADPDVQRLEALLNPLALRPGPDAIPPRATLLARPRRVWLALAAMVALAAGLAIFAAPRAGPGWEISSLEGSPIVGSRAVTDQSKLRVGQWLTTDESSRAQLQVATLGSVTVEGGSRLRLIRAEHDEKRLELARGTIHAFIVAPPRLFFVDTPAGVAADLGCAYTLTVADDGASDLKVTVGWVELQGAGRTSIVPAGAVCRMDRLRGPGTPYFPDSPPVFVERLAEIDAGRAAALGGLARAVSPREGLALWHLIPRLEGEARAEAVAALARVVPPPAGVAIEGELDRPALEAWWGVIKERW